MPGFKDTFKLWQVIKNLNDIFDGGTEGEVLTKDSATDFDFDWGPPKAILPTVTTYAGDASGTSGSTNTAQTIITRVLAANGLTQAGDRIRIRTWMYITGGAAITVTTRLNGVDIGDVTHTGAGEFDVTESWLHYVDDTHANLIEQETGTGLGSLSAVNVAGFDWDASQNIVIHQSAASGGYATVYGIFVDIFPLGVV